MPAFMFQHLDTGGVRIEVTCISNGSIVVEFTLLVLEDVDVREVSAAFLAAFRNTTLLEVVRGDTFIGGRRRPGPVGDSLPKGGSEILPVASFLKDVPPRKGFPAWDENGNL